MLWARQHKHDKPKMKKQDLKLTDIFSFNGLPFFISIEAKNH